MEQVSKATDILALKVTSLLDIGTLIIDSVQLHMKSPMDPKKILTTKANFSINVEPVITRELKSSILEKHGNEIGWFKNNLYFPLMMRYRSALYIHLSQGFSTRKVTACLWMKEIYDNDWQEVSLALRHYNDMNAGDELPWGDEGPCGNITLRLKFVPGFSPAHTELPEFTVDMLGADPFQNDDTQDKAHLLVQQEGTDNYAVNIPSDKKPHRPSYANTVDNRPASLFVLPGQNSGKKDLVITQEDNVPVLIQKEPHYPIVKERLANQEAPIINCPIPNTDERRTSAANVTFNTIDKRTSTGSTLFNSYDRRASTSTGATVNSDYRRSSASTGTTFNSENERASTSTETTFISVDRRISNSTALNTGNKSNEIVEVETVGYLEAMEEDLENSKIHKYSIIRKLSKGKDRFVKKVKTLRQGHNSQARASKAIVEEA